jgi:hypothetical protein
MHISTGTRRSSNAKPCTSSRSHRDVDIIQQYYPRPAATSERQSRTRSAGVVPFACVLVYGYHRQYAPRVGSSGSGTSRLCFNAACKINSLEPALTVSLPVLRHAYSQEPGQVVTIDVDDDLRAPMSISRLIKVKATVARQNRTLADHGVFALNMQPPGAGRPAFWSARSKSCDSQGDHREMVTDLDAPRGKYNVPRPSSRAWHL